MSIGEFPKCLNPIDRYFDLDPEVWRKIYAAMAMQGLLSNGYNYPTYGDVQEGDRAVECADNLIKALEKSHVD